MDPREAREIRETVGRSRETLGRSMDGDLDIEEMNMDDPEYQENIRNVLEVCRMTFQFDFMALLYFQY